MEYEPRLVPTSLDYTLRRLENKLDWLINKEDRMAAAESTETVALNEAIAELQTELVDVGAVDAEVVSVLEGVAAAVGKVNPTTPEQVNAVAAAASGLKELTAKLKAAAGPAAEAEGAVAPAAPESATSEPAAAEVERVAPAAPDAAAPDAPQEGAPPAAA